MFLNVVSKHMEWECCEYFGICGLKCLSLSLSLGTRRTSHCSSSRMWRVSRNRLSCPKRRACGPPLGERPAKPSANLPLPPLAGRQPSPLPRALPKNLQRERPHPAGESISDEAAPPGGMIAQHHQRTALRAPTAPPHQGGAERASSKPSPLTELK